MIAERRFTERAEVEDIYRTNTHSMPYTWIPASKLPYYQAPTILILHGYGDNKSANIFKNTGWNVLAPKDINGKDGQGSWWLGEKGNTFIVQMIENLVEEFEFAGLINRKNLYIYGKSMGGFAALMLGPKLRARAVYANLPFTKLLGSHYSTGDLETRFRSIVIGEGNRILDENNLVECLDLYANHPFYLLCNEHKNTKKLHHQEQCMDFITALEKRDLRYHLEVLPDSGGEIRRRITDAINLFKQFSPPLETPLRQSALSVLTKSQKPMKKRFIQIALSSRSEVNLTLPLRFDEDPFSDRSWRFWFQNLTWLKSHAANGGKKVTGEIEDILCCWLDAANRTNFPDFMYHDHAIAYRSATMCNLLPIIKDRELRAKIVEHIIEHAHLLSAPFEDNAFSNHGFDQAASLLTIVTCLEDHPLSEGWKKIALRRIHREMHYSFTSDGVHVENSPSYHHGMMTNIHKTLLELNILGGFDSLVKEITQNLENAAIYLRWIIRPDGTTPSIGDSESKIVSKTLAKKLSPEVFDNPATGLKVFEKSGYAIWRSETDKFHMTLKSCIHGRFHRHDDDCSMTLWHKGRDLILDAGLLYYQEQDRDRTFVRSAAGHSGFEISGLKPNRSPFKRTAADSRVESTTDGACAYQGMYERYKMNRTVNLEGKIVKISDRFGEKAHSMGARTNWLIPSVLTHSSAKDVITFSFENKPVMKFSWSSPCEIQIIESDDDNQNPIFYSPLKHKMIPARRLIVTPKEGALETIIELL